MNGIREALKRNNPFSSGVAGDPWDNATPDVASLNAEACDRICDWIRHKNKYPAQPMAGLVLGEAGAGKTHLLKRILNETRLPDRPTSAAFVFVKPLLDPEAPLQHLLQEIAVGLGKGAGVKACQMEHFVAHLMGEYSKGTGMTPFDVKRWVEYFQARFPEIHKDLLKAIFAYRNPGMRPSVLSWLRGAVDDEHASLLGVRDRSTMTGGEREDEARKIVLSLGMLMERYEKSMVICFDQLDNMKEQKYVDAFGKTVQMFDYIYGMLPLAFIRGDSWDMHFSGKLDPAIQGRFANNVVMLRNCTEQEAVELLRSRVEAFFGENAQDKADWLLERLRGSLDKGYSPRRIIELANQVIVREEEVLGKTPPSFEPPDPLRLFAEEYRQEYDKVAADFALWPPDTGRLTLTLGVWLENRPEYTNIRTGEDKYIALTADRADSEKTTPYAFVVNTAEHHKSVQAAFDRGIKFLEAHPGGVCIYLTDGRCKFQGKDKWIKVHQARDAFSKLGGRELFLDPKRAIDWYGLTSLIFKVENGDVSLAAPQGVRPASMADLGEFLKKGFEGDLLEKAEESGPVGPLPVDPGDEVPHAAESSLENRIREILRASPMHIMTATMLLGMLNERGEAVSHEYLLAFVNERRESFLLYPAAGGSTIVLR